MGYDAGDENVGIDVIGLVDLLDYIFKDEKVIGFADMVELVLQLRSSNTCTVKHIVELRKQLRHEVNLLGQRLESSLQKDWPSNRAGGSRKTSDPQGAKAGFLRSDS